mmetsp:Transcript_1525/g.3394  ORF Transcript_1525/g.3394 Transcript_1525/m.3394 type:complete len:247 (-) Transcript_1525:762-1502(-)
MAFRWIDDVEGLGFDDGIFDGGKDASFDGSRRRRSRGTGATGLALTRDGIASPSSSSRSGTAFPSAAMTASTTMPSLSVVTLRLRGICFFAKIVARIRRRGAEGAAGAILGGIGGVVQTGIAAVVGGIAFGGAASSSSVTGATGGADASSGGGMATGASISSLLLLLLLLLLLQVMLLLLSRLPIHIHRFLRVIPSLPLLQHAQHVNVMPAVMPREHDDELNGQRKAQQRHQHQKGAAGGDGLRRR